MSLTALDTEKKTHLKELADIYRSARNAHPDKLILKREFTPDRTFSVGDGTENYTYEFAELNNRIYTPSGDYWAETEWARETINEADLALRVLSAKTLDHVHVIDEALLKLIKNRDTQTEEVIRYGHSAAIAVTRHKVTFAWRSPASLTTDALTFRGRLLEPSEDHQYNEASFPLSERNDWEAKAKHLNLSLISERIA